MKKISFLFFLFLIPLILLLVPDLSRGASLQECQYFCPENSDYYTLYPKPGNRTEDFRFDRSECIRMCLNDTAGAGSSVEDFFRMWRQSKGYESESTEEVINVVNTPRVETEESGSEKSSFVGSLFEFPNPLKIKTVGELLEAIIKWLFWLALPLTVIFILYAAYLFITSGGKADVIKKAKNTLLYALIGFAIILLANSIPYLIKDILSHGSANGTPPSSTPTSSGAGGTGGGGSGGGGRSEDEEIKNCLNQCEAYSEDETDYNNCLDSCLGF